MKEPKLNCLEDITFLHQGQNCGGNSISKQHVCNKNVIGERRSWLLIFHNTGIPDNICCTTFLCQDRAKVEPLHVFPPLPAFPHITSPFLAFLTWSNLNVQGLPGQDNPASSCNDIHYSWREKWIMFCSGLQISAVKRKKLVISISPLASYTFYSCKAFYTCKRWFKKENVNKKMKWNKLPGE